MISGIKKKAVQAQKGMTYSTKPKGIVVGDDRYVIARGFDVINSSEAQPNGEGIKPLVALTGTSLKDKSPEELLTLVQPPDPRVHFALSDSEASTLTSLNEAVNKQLIQQFYEAYHAPTGLMDATYRLGAVQASIDDVHQLYPNGMAGLLSSDADAAWRTNVNYVFSVDENMKDANGKAISPYIFKSYSFPPFISKSETDFNAYKLDGTPTIASKVAYTLDRSFDLNNLLYKGNKATIRTPAFKSINDNINTIQFMYNRAFGIESTYINEWDLTMYMQEGIVQYLEQPNVYNPNENIYLPQFVTTLTYGLVNDAPIAENARNTSGTKTLDINDVTPFASWNMAVSTRKSVDNTMVAQACNTMSYEISHYPLSTYWYPSLMGQNLDYQTYFTYVKQLVYDQYGLPEKDKNGKEKTIDVPVTHYTDMNVASYIDQLFAYRQSGKVWAPYAEEEAGGMKKYSPSHLHGNDLRNSICSFEYVLAHADARDAVLSGWNSTDVEGNPYVPGNSKVNDYVGSNAYSYLPFWKQFFFSPSDGMEELDQYWQEIQGSTETRKSILEAAQEILNITCAENEPFKSFCIDREEEYIKHHPNDANALANLFTMSDDSSSGYGDIKVRLPVVGSVTIPKTKLLNMFIHRKEQENKANAAKNRQQAQFVNNTFANIANVGKKSVGGSESGAQKAIDQANSKDNEQSTIVYDIQNDEEDLGSTISYGEGVNNHSPFLYGGPHGAFYSPQTLEGYCQQENEVMETVPTMDAVERYNYRRNNGFAKRKHVIGSKNFKLGNYADAKVCTGLSERGSVYNLMVKNIDPDIQMYYSGGWSSDHIRRVSACWDWKICIRFFRRKKCWRFCIPTRFIIWENRFSWSWPFLWVFGKWENKYWRNYSAGHTVYAWRTVKLSEIQRDFSNQFTLVPQGYRTRMNSNWKGDWDKAKENDTELYKNNPGKWEPLAGGDNYNLDLGSSNQLGPRGKKGIYKNHPTLRYIVAETSGDYVIEENTDEGGIKGHYLQDPKDPESKYLFGKRVNAYYKPGSVFETIKRNLYVYANGSGGISEYFTITLPICNRGNRDDIVNLCCGVANVEKQRVKAVEYRTTYKWVNNWIYSWYTHHHGWWGHRLSTWSKRQQVICARWIARCHPRWWSWVNNRIKVYYEYPVEVERDAYTMYFYPDLMKYSIPTNGYLPTANNELSRDKSTSSIIDRWSVNTNEDSLHGTKPLTSLIDWFPFSSQFQNTFGTGDLEEPGTHYGSKNKVGPCLRTRGLLIGDIMQIYHNHGKKVFIRGGNGYMWLWSSARVGYQRYVHEFDVGCYLYVTNTSTNYRSWTIPLRSQYQIAANTGGFEDPVLTAVVEDICKAPAVLQYHLNDDTHNGAPLSENRRFQFYNVSDVFDVYIDTVTVQLTWVEQMLEFSKAYLNDYTIWKTYNLVTDNKIKNIISEAAGTYMCPDNWMTDIYKTGNATEDINYYDALMIVKLAFGYQQNSPDTNKNTIAALIERRISDLKLLKEAAINFKNIGATWDNLNNFAKFVSDTKAVLDNVNGARERMFVNNRVVTMPGIYDSIFFNQRGHITFNLVENPSTLIWAYLNVLYQARKFYINKRLDKVQGSYWIMRSLERVMTFQAAQAQNENRKDLLNTPSYESPRNQNKQIAFSMSRDDPTTESQKTEIDLTPSYTKAIWVPVDYVKHPDPTSTPDYVKGVFDGKEKVTYRGREIVYVPEVYKWAYKPADGLYYVMSQDISNNIRNYVATYTELASQIENELDDINLETISQADSLGPITTEDLDKVAQKGTENGEPVYHDWKGNKRVYNWFVGKNLLEIPDVILYSRYSKKTFGTIESSTIYAQASDIVIRTFNVDDLTLDYSKVILVVVSNLDPNRIVSVTDKGVLKEGTFRFDEEKNLILVTKIDQTLEGYLGELLASSTYKYDPSVQELSDLSKHRYDNWQLEVANLIYKNRIIQAYHNSLFGKANELMYPIYIEWTPSATGSAMTESDLKKPECHYIDDYQLMESSTRVSQYEIMEREGLDPSWEWPTVTDGKNLDHKVGILRSGITFGVAAGVNIDTIVSNIQLLGNSTTQEIACAATDKKDYWRIEIPDANEPQNEGLGHNIPIALLEHKPVLVSNYMFQMFEKEMQGIVNPTVETTLVGLSSNALSPVKDFNPEMVTAATLAATGELPSLQSLGIPGLTANEAESHFG